MIIYDEISVTVNPQTTKIVEVGGNISLTANTGNLLNVFYPLNSNPSGYITSGDATKFSSLFLLMGV